MPILNFKSNTFSVDGYIVIRNTQRVSGLLTTEVLKFMLEEIQVQEMSQNLS